MPRFSTLAKMLDRRAAHHPNAAELRQIIDQARRLPDEFGKDLVINATVALERLKAPSL